MESSEQLLMVAVSHEELIVEHLTPEQYDPGAAVGPDETIIPVFEEQLVVEKRQVITGYVRMRKQLVTTQQEVRGQVRREVLSVDTTGVAGSTPPLVQEQSAR